MIAVIRKKTAGKPAKKKAVKKKPGIAKKKALAVSPVNIPVINIGLVGHVDHGKTTLAEALTNKWTDTHSEEMRRGITIRLGYADVTFYRCVKCGRYCSTKKCPKCFSDCEPTRTVSFVDAPGHETLMATVLSGASLMDAAILLIAANERCPQPQTTEHLLVLNIAEIKRIIIVQNKIDLVTEEEARKNYQQIKEFVKGTVAENAPIIPVSAQRGINIDAVIEEIEKIPTPERDAGSDVKIYVARSFDVNKPGTKPKDLVGGVLGGSVVRGVLKPGDEIEIKPGVKLDEKWTPLKTDVISIQQAGMILERGEPGGLVGIMTSLDPSLCRADSLSGNIAGVSLPETTSSLKLEVNLFDHAIGTEQAPTINTGDALMITAAVIKTVGIVTSAHGSKAEITLKLPVCVDGSERLALSKQIGGRWHLIGYGTMI